jgi:2-keto-4-pentenoate hydratase/2-oxohepta-3-ene-1,7-dioic acid hydratase in catechol pathway
VVFLKPESALIPKHGPIVLPTFSNDIQHEIELVYSIIRKNGKAQADKVSIGLDLTARSLQKALKDGGLPGKSPNPSTVRLTSPRPLQLLSPSRPDTTSISC